MSASSAKGSGTDVLAGSAPAAAVKGPLAPSAAPSTPQRQGWAARAGTDTVEEGLSQGEACSTNRMLHRCKTWHLGVGLLRVALSA
jgi:hypothetical protein